MAAWSRPGPGDANSFGVRAHPLTGISRRQVVLPTDATSLQIRLICKLRVFAATRIADAQRHWQALHDRDPRLSAEAKAGCAERDTLVAQHPGGQRKLASGRTRCGRQQVRKDLAGDMSLDAAHDFGFGLASAVRRAT
jgi:hypothetical protein